MPRAGWITAHQTQTAIALALKSWICSNAIDISGDSLSMSEFCICLSVISTWETLVVAENPHLTTLSYVCIHNMHTCIASSIYQLHRSNLSALGHSYPSISCVTTFLSFLGNSPSSILLLFTTCTLLILTSKNILQVIFKVKFTFLLLLCIS